MIGSPCTGVCRIDPRSRLCSGCLRTLDEIAQWGGADDRRKQGILDNVQARRRALPAAPTPDQAD